LLLFDSRGTSGYCLKQAVLSKQSYQQLERPNKAKVPVIDSLPTTAPTPTSPVNISENAIEDEVEYGAKDSINYDNKNNRVH